MYIQPVISKYHFMVLHFLAKPHRYYCSSNFWKDQTKPICCDKRCSKFGKKWARDCRFFFFCQKWLLQEDNCDSKIYRNYLLPGQFCFQVWYFSGRTGKFHQWNVSNLCKFWMKRIRKMFVDGRCNPWNNWAEICVTSSNNCWINCWDMPFGRYWINKKRCLKIYKKVKSSFEKESRG